MDSVLTPLHAIELSKMASSMLSGSPRLAKNSLSHEVAAQNEIAAVENRAETKFSDSEISNETVSVNTQQPFYLKCINLVSIVAKLFLVNNYIDFH